MQSRCSSLADRTVFRPSQRDARPGQLRARSGDLCGLDARRGAGPPTVWMFRRAGQVLLALDLCAMVIIASAHTAHLVRSCWAMT